MILVHFTARHSPDACFSKVKNAALGVAIDGTLVPSCQTMGLDSQLPTDNLEDQNMSWQDSSNY